MGGDSPSHPVMNSSPPTALAPGFRFHPTDEELVWYYLRRKVSGMSFRFDAISEADIYKVEPWDLPGKSRLKSRDLEWYFFSALDKKYGNGVRMNRSTNRGYWKTTGKDRVVRHNSQMVGMKKTLVFHSGRAPGGERTNWVMHEYRLADAESEKTGVPKDAFVLCRVFQKSGLGPPNGDRYAPFIEEEWDNDNDVSVLVPKEEGGDELTGVEEEIELELDISQSVKMENSDEDCSELGRGLSLSCPEPLPLFPNKRSREANLPPPQEVAIQDRGSSTPTLTLAPMMMTTTYNPNPNPDPSSEFVLSESVERRAAAETRSLNFGAFLPPAYNKLLHDLQAEIHSISAEKAALRIELIGAQATASFLQSQLLILMREEDIPSTGAA